MTDIEVGSTTVTDRFSSSSYYGHGTCQSVTAAAGPGAGSVPALCPGWRSGVLPVGWCDSDSDSADTDIDPILNIGPAVCGPLRD